MSDAVLDASVLVAALSPSEIHHVRARALYDSVADDRPFLVPALFRIEVIAALARRGESSELLDIVQALVHGPRFHAVVVDSSLLGRALDVARTARLRAYDAVYVALALHRKASLLTLDLEMSARACATYPDLSVLTPGQGLSHR